MRYSNGAERSFTHAASALEDADLLNTVLGYLVTRSYFGNPQLEAIAAIETSAAEQIVQFSRNMARQTVSTPYVERFSVSDRPIKGSIVVCLYGKPEYLFLQNALFSARPGMQDYEIVYVSNSPELAEQLLREARISKSIYGIDQTLVILSGNAGFGAANNVATNYCRSNRFLIVNPDVFPYDEDWAAKHTELVETRPADQVRLFGLPLYYSDGSLMHGGMYFDCDVGLSVARSGVQKRDLIRVEHYGKGAPPRLNKFLRPRPVPAVTGAFISVDRPWFEALGGFTEDYVFGHYEDADLCLKSLSAGTPAWLHDIKLWHLEGKGSTRFPAHEGGSLVNRWLFSKRGASISPRACSVRSRRILRSASYPPTATKPYRV